MRVMGLLILLFASGTSTALYAADEVQGAPVVQACVDKEGQLVSSEIVQTSGFPELDAAALKIAKATKYSPAMVKGKKKKLSCVKFKVKFVIRDGEPVPSEG